ncbi:MAG: DsbA family protein [Hyphomicrobiaceae bacterium]|nr:DsbA family protein [Hyphomicrobiaceae bacterium]
MLKLPFEDLLAALTTRKGVMIAAPAIIAVAAILTLIGRPTHLEAQETGAAEKAPLASTFSPSQKSEIERIVKDYLVANPEVFLEIQQALEAKMEQAQSERMKAALAANADKLYRDPAAPIAGNPKGDVTIVEFFDYNCGYCKRGFSEIARLIDADPKVKFVFRELPILSKGSEEAARVALAARLQGKYWEFHSLMIEFKGQANEASAMKIAEKIGLDTAKLKKDMTSETVENEIKTVRELAQTLGINGTPHFLVGDRSIPGAPQDLFEQLKKDVAEVRKAGCTSC